MRALEECSGSRAQAVPERLSKLVTPLRWEVWQRELKAHPDRALVELLQRGISEGFRISYEAGRASLKAKERNMLSAAEVVSNLAEELREERIA